MSKNVYQIKGSFKMGRLNQAFNTQMVGADEAEATERLYTEFGSRHGVKRREITIDTIGPAEGDINSIRAKQAEA